MTQPNFRMADVMTWYINRDGRDKRGMKSDLDTLRDYRKYHPAKFRETLKWAFGSSPEAAKIREMTAPITKRMALMHETLRQGKRSWEGHLFKDIVLDCYDWRTINALRRRGLIKFHYANHEGTGKQGYYLKPLR